MGLIKKELKIKGDKGDKNLEVLFDSGASVSVIRQDIAEEICTINYFKEAKPMTLADGETTIDSVGTCTFITGLEGCEIDDDMRVVDKLNSDMIIGASTLQKHEIKMYFDEKKGDKLDLSKCRKRIDYL